MIYIIPTNTCFGIACSLTDKKSYHEIYRIKKRPLSKPLAIMVDSFDWLQKNTTLNRDQIDFLKRYPNPWTVLTNCKCIEEILNSKQKDFGYKNKEIYKKIAFRVAHNSIQKKLISEIGPIFLTSANISGEKEIYSIDEVKRRFGNFKNIKFLRDENTKLLPMTKPSDIFEFDGESVKVKYLRR